MKNLQLCLISAVLLCFTANRGFSQNEMSEMILLDFSPASSDAANFAAETDSAAEIPVTLPASSRFPITDPLPNVYWQPKQSPGIAQVTYEESSYFGDNASYGSIAPGIYWTQAPGTAPGYAPINAASPVTSPPPANPAVLDPYATPGGGPYFTPPPASGGTASPDFSSNMSHTYSEMKRMLDKITFEYYYAPNTGSQPLGINDLKLQSRFAFPCQHLGNTMVYVTPSFGLTLFNADDQKNVKIRDQAYSAWLDAGIEPVLNEQVRFDLWARFGVFSDLRKVDGNSLRLLGRGNVYVKLNPRMEVAVGVVYLNRERVKLLPSGGLLWRPNDTVEWRLVFPDPKVARKLAQRNNTEWWGFARADYGGNCWSFKTEEGTQRIDYNDIRVSLGLEFRNPTTACADGFFEIGGLFSRELYSAGQKYYSPSTSLFLGAGIYY
ncbi:MAG: hypothetical protein LBQ54_01170 [Planctomycetaceae bacterium]|jgi:hypothetical protein|nr:hypothetical protein [Planctomycetaceae bacterium]